MRACLAYTLLFMFITLNEFCLSQNIVFTSQSFKSQILSPYDLNQDGEISIQEADLVTYIGIGGPSLNSIEDIKHFKNLNWLYVTGANISSHLFQGNKRLKRIVMNNCNLNSIFVHNLDSLERLTLRQNNIQSINLSQNRELFYLRLSFNPINTLDISNNINLNYVIVDHTDLTSIDISKLCELIELWTFNTNIESLDITYFSTIVELFINDMPLLNNVCVWPNFDPDTIPAFSDNDSQPNYIECYFPDTTQNCHCTKKANTNSVLPNVFKPNGDGFNEFYKTNIYDYSYYHLEIFNRWGHLVFQSNDQNNSWNGDQYPTGSYFAVLTYKLNCPDSKTKSLTNFVHLQRD